MTIYKLHANIHSNDKCKFNKNFLYNLLVQQIFYPTTENTRMTPLANAATSALAAYRNSPAIVLHELRIKQVYNHILQTCRLISYKAYAQPQDNEELSVQRKSSIGWFYSFKLHIVINNRGKIIQ